MFATTPVFCLHPFCVWNSGSSHWCAPCPLASPASLCAWLHCKGLCTNTFPKACAPPWSLLPSRSRKLITWDLLTWSTQVITLSVHRETSHPFLPQRKNSFLILDSALCLILSGWEWVTTLPCYVCDPCLYLPTPLDFLYLRSWTLTEARGGVEIFLEPVLCVLPMKRPGLSSEIQAMCGMSVWKKKQTHAF